eukprot:6184798-Pleurochrysis_carterae.AAC.1
MADLGREEPRHGPHADAEAGDETHDGANSEWRRPVVARVRQGCTHKTARVQTEVNSDCIPLDLR